MKPICLQKYPEMKVNKEIFKKEVELLVLLGFLEVENYQEQGNPSFEKPKPKSNWVRFIGDFRNLNKQLNRKPYPMTKINEVLLKVEGFQYSTPLDLNIGY